MAPVRNRWKQTYSRWTKNRWIRNRAFKLTGTINPPATRASSTQDIQENNYAERDFDISSVNDEESCDFQLPINNLDGSSYENCESHDNSQNHAETSEIRSALTTSEKLVEIGIKHNLSHSALKDITALLVDLGHDIHIDPRTLMRTSRTVTGNKSFIHIGLAKQIIRIAGSGFKSDFNGTLILQLNIDGIPLYPRSTNKLSFWPILGRLVNCRDSRPFTISVFCGYVKPPSLENYTRPLINELKELITNGITVNNVRYNLKLSAVICDAPARAFVKEIKGHSSREGCERCIQKGVFLSRMTFPHLSSPLRTDLSFRNQTHKNHHKGISPFTELNIDMVRSFPLDYLHLYCLGVNKKWLGIITDGSGIDVQHKLNKDHQNIIHDNLTTASKSLPVEINRKFDSFFNSHQWKGSQHRTFGFYLGPVILKGNITEEKYNHFLLVHVAMRILSSAHSTIDQVRYAGQCLKRYVYEFGQIYGEHHLVYNLHSLSHLADDYEHLNGPVDAYSAFPFETFLGHMKKLLRGTKRPLAQLQRRLSEMENNSKVMKNLAFQYVEKHCKSGFNALKPGSQSDAICLVYETAKKPLVIKVNRKSHKDEIVFGHVFNIVRDESDDGFFEFYTYPVKATDLSIFVCDGLIGREKKWHSNFFENCVKCMAIPWVNSANEHRTVILPLLNQQAYGFI